MEAVEFSKLQFASLRRQVDSVLIDRTDEQCNWNPPGTANSIRSELIHRIATEDFYVYPIILGGERIGNRQNWGEIIGLSAPPSPAAAGMRSSGPAASRTCDWLIGSRPGGDRCLRRAAHPGGIGSPGALYGRERPVAEVFTRLFIHTALHAGKIAAIRDLQGV